MHTSQSVPPSHFDTLSPSCGRFPMRTAGAFHAARPHTRRHGRHVQATTFPPPLAAQHRDPQIQTSRQQVSLVWPRHQPPRQHDGPIRLLRADGWTRKCPPAWFQPWHGKKRKLRTSALGPRSPPTTRCIGWRYAFAAYSDALARLSNTLTVFAPPIATAVVSVVGRPVPSSTTILACRPLVPDPTDNSLGQMAARRL